MRLGLLSKETDDVSEIPNETEDGPVVGPEAESLVVGVSLEGKVCFPKGNDDYDCVVD